MSSLDGNHENFIKILLDDITFMLFDLERGGFIENSTPLDIEDGFVITYNRELIEETIVDGWKTIISDFFIVVNKDNAEILNFQTRGKERKFSIVLINEYLSTVFIEKLENFRKLKFQINT